MGAACRGDQCVLTVGVCIGGADPVAAILQVAVFWKRAPFKCVNAGVKGMVPQPEGLRLQDRGDVDCAMFVAGLAGVGVEGRAGEFVYGGVVHRDEYLAGWDCGGDEGAGGDGRAGGGDADARVGIDGESAGVGGVDFDVAVGGGEGAEDVAFIGAGAGVPLGGAAAAREQGEGEFGGCGFGRWFGGGVDEAGAAVGGVELAVGEETAFLGGKG